MLCELYCDPHLNKEGLCLIHCADRCPDVCKYVVMPDSSVAPFLPGLLPPPSPPPPPHGLVVLPSIPRQVPPIRHVDHFNRHHLIVISTVITACLIGTALLFCAAYTLIKIFNSRRNNSRSRNTPILFDTTTHQDFLDEHEGPILDHPIWYINTVGFQQSVIDSISMLKYKKDEGLIDGTDCSICLGEFQEEESLRLLPKCSHAFHLPCIDTWLRSHKNCPLCRAPIFANNTGPHSDGSSSREETRIEILDGNNGISDQGNNQIDSNEDVVDNMLQRDNGRDEDMMFDEIPRWNRGNFEWRVLSDLTENRELVKEEVEPIRRSVSLDSLSASMIHQAMASDAARLVVDARDMDSEEKVVKGEGRGKIELVKSSSMRHSVQKGSVSMKRSFSSSRKLFLSRHSRGQSSILPL